MENNIIDLNFKIPQYDDSILLEIIGKLETIIKEINDNNNLENKIRDVISIMNDYIKENKKNYDYMVGYIDNLNKEYTKVTNKLVNINNNININNEVQEKIFISKA